jgi:hypothetical protein
MFLCVNGVWQKDGKPIAIFPVQAIRSDRSVPREVAEEAYKEYAEQYGSSQTLDRLGERGGFGASEIAILLFERIKRLERSR